MPVTLATLKAALRIGYTDDDAELTRLLAAAESYVERRTGVALSSGTQTMYLASFADTMVPVHPFTSLTSVAYTYGGSSVTMAAADYYVDRSCGPLPVLRFLKAPATDEGTPITVTYVAGYASIPNELVSAIIGITGAWYNNPEASQPISLSVVPMGTDAILDLWQVRSPLR